MSIVTDKYWVQILDSHFKISSWLVLLQLAKLWFLHWMAVIMHTSCGQGGEGQEEAGKGKEEGDEKTDEWETQDNHEVHINVQGSWHMLPWVQCNFLIVLL